MSVTKQYFKSKPYCKVTFRLEKQAVGEAKKAAIAAEFNNWQAEKTPMKLLKNGGFTATVNLDKGREYQYRYVVDGRTWITDDSAEKYVYCDFADCDNAIVVI